MLKQLCTLTTHVEFLISTYTILAQASQSKMKLAQLAQKLIMTHLDFFRTSQMSRNKLPITRRPFYSRPGSHGSTILGDISATGSANRQLLQPRDKQAFAPDVGKNARRGRCNRIANTASSLISRAVVKERVDRFVAYVGETRRGTFSSAPVATAATAAASVATVADRGAVFLFLSCARARFYTRSRIFSPRRKTGRRENHTGALLAPSVSKDHGRIASRSRKRANAIARDRR